QRRRAAHPQRSVEQVGFSFRQFAPKRAVVADARNHQHVLGNDRCQFFDQCQATYHNASSFRITAMHFSQARALSLHSLIVLTTSAERLTTRYGMSIASSPGSVVFLYSPSQRGSPISPRYGITTKSGTSCIILTRARW